MHFSCAAVVLATAAIAQVVSAGPLGAGHHEHMRRHQKGAQVLKVEAEAEKRDVDWSKVHYTYSVGQTWGQPTPAAAPVNAPANPAPAAAAAPTPAPVSNPIVSAVTDAFDDAKDFLKGLGLSDCGINSKSAGGASAWIGSDGPYVNDFINSSKDKITLVIWGSEGSWVNVKRPIITQALKPGSKTTISFSNGAVGAWAAIYPNTKLVNGQISETWGEFTMAPMGVVDVSREVNMSGHGMKIEHPKCVSDFSKCYFQCTDGSNSCLDNYALMNCENGSQPGATKGQFAGKDSGGCGGLGDSTHLTTTFMD